VERRRDQLLQRQNHRRVHGDGQGSDKRHAPAIPPRQGHHAYCHRHSDRWCQQQAPAAGHIDRHRRVVLEPGVGRVIDTPTHGFRDPDALVHEQLLANWCREKQPGADGHDEQHDRPGRDEGRVSHDLGHRGARVHHYTRHTAHSNFLS
jgi:hypothetical protein